MNISKRYLRQPRGKGWTFKMETPKELIGVKNPWSGVPFQKTIHIGLNTQDLRDAAQQRDLILAEITRLRRQVSGEERLSDARAIRWGEHFRAGLVEPVVRSVELANGEEVEEEIVIEHDLIEAEAEQVARERGHAAAERYADIALGRATPLGKLFDDYLEARDDLSISSVRELKTERRRLADFLGKDLDEVMIEEITSKQSHPFLRQYLPNLKTPRAPNGLAPETIDRAKVLLSGLWEWARDQGHVPLDHQNPWKGLPKAFAQKKRKGPQRRIFTPEEWRKLLDSVEHGDPLRDVMVLAMHTGARLENLLEIEQVDADGSGFRVLSGKTNAAVRWVPVVHPEAVEVLLRRRRQFPEGSIFGDATISKATGERSTPMSKRFGKLRRKVLPEVPDGELVLHCAGHTWRTAALRAEVSDSATRQLGGWIDEGRDTSSPYNHGLTRDQLREAMEQIVGWIEVAAKI